MGKDRKQSKRFEISHSIKSETFHFRSHVFRARMALQFYGAFYSQIIPWKMPVCYSAITLLLGETIVVLKGFDCHL